MRTLVYIPPLFRYFFVILPVACFSVEFSPWDNESKYFCIAIQLTGAQTSEGVDKYVREI